MCRAMPPPSEPSKSAKRDFDPTRAILDLRRQSVGLSRDRVRHSGSGLQHGCLERAEPHGHAFVQAVAMRADGRDRFSGRLFEASVQCSRTDPEVRERSIGRGYEAVAQLVHMLRQEVSNAAFPAFEHPLQGLDRGFQGFAGCRDAIFPFVQDLAQAFARMDQGFLSRGGSLPDQDRNLFRRSAEFPAPVCEETIEQGAGLVQDFARRRDMLVEQARQASLVPPRSLPRDAIRSPRLSPAFRRLSRAAAVRSSIVPSRWSPAASR